MFELIESNSQHFYYHPIYGRVPSVSEILTFTESQEDIERLRKWEHKMDKVHGVGSASQSRKDSMNRGTELHELVERYWERFGTLSNVDNKFFRSVLPFLECFQDKNKRLYVEQIFGSKDYAGRVDFVGIYHDEPVIIDFTTSLRPKRKQWLERKFLQCAAYSNLIYLNTDLDINNIAVVVATPETYQYFPSEASEYYPKWVQRFEQYKRVMSSSLFSDSD